MRIAKPIRFLLYGALTGAGTVLSFRILLRAIGWWAVIPTVVCFFLFWFLGAFLVDSCDTWLRRVTKDPIWLKQHQQTKKTSRKIV